VHELTKLLGKWKVRADSKTNTDNSNNLWHPILEEPKAFMGISNSKNCAFGCNQTDYPDFFSFRVKRYQLFGNMWRKRFIVSLKLN